MDMDIMRSLERLPLNEARELAKSQLSMNKSSPRYLHLIRDLDAAKTSREVERIMWNVLLAGEGFAMTDSAWQKMHGTK